jgi:drug/metabolite transporter (DMT)-like permease
MTWQLAISFSIIANVVTALIQRRYSQKSTAPPSFPSAISYLLGVMPIGIVVGLRLPHQVHWSYWLIFLLCICAGSMALSGWLAFRAIKLLPIIAYQTISRFTSVVSIALGWIILSEGLSFVQLIGAAVLLLAAILVIWAPARNIATLQRKVHFQAVILTLLAATMSGISLVTEKGILGHMQPGGVLIVGWGSQTIAMLLLALKDANRQNLHRFGINEIKWSTLLGLAAGTSGVFYVYALSRSDNISLIISLTAITLPLIALGARLLLKERENEKILWTSLLISFLGLLLTAA